MSRRPDPVASRRAILEAARACFSQSGYAGTSMHDIAAAAGVTQSLIHHHFGAKDTLWKEVRAFAFGEYVKQQRKLIESGGRDLNLLRTSMETYFNFLARNPDILRLVAWLELDRPVEFIDQIKDLYADGVAVIEAGQAAGQLRTDIPARYILTAFIGLVRNWFQERHLISERGGDSGQGHSIDQAYLAVLWDVFSRGTNPPSASAAAVPAAVPAPDLG